MKFSILGSMSCLATCLFFTFNNAKAEETNKITVNDNLKKIVFDLNGASTIKVIETDDYLQIKEIKYSGISNNPITIEESKDKILIKQKNNKTTSFSISYNLYLPKSKIVEIDAGSLKISGNMNVNKLTLSSGSLNSKIQLSCSDTVDIIAGSAKLDMNVTAAQKINFKIGAGSGTISVPASTEISGLSAWNKIKVKKK